MKTENPVHSSYASFSFLVGSSDSTKDAIPITDPVSVSIRGPPKRVHEIKNIYNQFVI